MVLNKLCQRASSIVRMRGTACFSLGIADDRLHLRSLYHHSCIDIPNGLFIPLDGSSEFSRAVMGAMATGAPASCDAAISLGPLTVSGRSIIAPIIWRRTPIEDDEEPIQRPIGVVLFWDPIDGTITESDVVMAESFARQSSSILVEERLIEIDEATVAFTSVPVALVLLDSADQVLLINPMAERLLNDRLGTESVLSDVDRGCQLSSMVHRARIATDGRSSSSFTGADGETFSATAQVARDGDCVLALSKIHLSSSAEQLVGQVAHELRTPLTVIQGNVQTADMILEGELAEGDIPLVREMLEVAISQCGRMARQISETLNVARIQAGRQVELNNSTFDLAEAARSLLAELSDYVANHTLNVDIPKACEVTGDRDKLISVMDNLLRNAIKYSPGGGVVGMRIARTAEGLVIVVTDHGIGIPPDAIERIGREPGFRTDESRGQADGIGLGMVYVRRVVGAHGGTMTITSDLGRGSEFSVSIPQGGDLAEHQVYEV